MICSKSIFQKKSIYSNCSVRFKPYADHIPENKRGRVITDNEGTQIASFFTLENYFFQFHTGIRHAERG